MDNPNPPAPFPPREGGAEGKNLSSPPSLGGKGAGGLGLLLFLAPLVAAQPDDTQSSGQLQWSSWLSALVLAGALAVIFARWRRGGTLRLEAVTFSFAVLLSLVFVSLAARLVVQHGVAYAGPMLRAWATLAMQFAMFVLARQAARAGRVSRYAVALAVIAAATIVAALGVGEYATFFAAGDRNYRVFATSSPDFLAAFLVIVLPVTLALFLSAPAAHRLPLLFGLALVLQLAALLLTGSRFALVSLAVGIQTFALALWRAGKEGMTMEAATRKRAITLLLIVGVVGLAAARPVVNRLLHSEANSGAFRVWTWRGTAQMIAANPLFGTGVGTFVSAYPRYALTGFTRLAHNGYLQTAAECGLPALFVLLLTLGLTARAGWRRLPGPSTVPGHRQSPSPPGPLSLTGERGSKNSSPHPLPREGEGGGARATPGEGAKSEGTAPSLFPADDRLLLAGMLGGLTAGAVQNLVDSDWQVFFVGTTFWALAGLTVGLAGRDGGARIPCRPILTAAGAVGVALFVLTATGGMAAWFGAQSQTHPANAESALRSAERWDPLAGRYPSALGYKVYAARGDWTAAEAALRRAVAREPSPINWRRLGDILDRQGRRADALAAYRNGLRADPNHIELLLTLAQKSPPPQSLDYYRRLSALELSPVGTVRAIGGVTETAFAVADAVLADAFPAEAPVLLPRAARLLEAYADEGGSTRRERMLQSGGRPNPARDRDMAALYQSVMTHLARQAGADATELERRRVEYDGKFQSVIEQAQKSGTL